MLEKRGMEKKVWSKSERDSESYGEWDHYGLNGLEMFFRD